MRKPFTFYKGERVTDFGGDRGIVTSFGGNPKVTRIKWQSQRTLEGYANFELRNCEVSLVKPAEKPICRQRENGQIKVLTSQRFILRKGNYEISAEKNGSGALTLFTKEGKREFIFENSKPETIRAIGELLIKVGELGKK